LNLERLPEPLSVAAGEIVRGRIEGMEFEFVGESGADATEVMDLEETRQTPVRIVSDHAEGLAKPGGTSDQVRTHAVLSRG